VEESVDCDGPASAETKKCSILLATLIVSPYNLVLNEEIWAKVVATNFYGDSVQSVAGNNGLTKLVPDSPVNLVNDAAVTDAT
jgi:hypothetical protein